MIEVSNAWKNAHKEMILPESFVEISLEIADVDAKATFTCDKEADFSNSTAIVNNKNFDVSTTYAFLEHNLWSLDGSRTIMSSASDYTPPAYVAMNDHAVTAQVTLANTSTKPIPGFLIEWSNEFGTYPTDFYVEVYNGGELKNFFQVTNNRSVKTYIDCEIEGFDQIGLIVNTWSHPDQRIRIDSIFLGQRKVFGKDEITSYTHEMSGCPLGTELSKNSIEFSVDNTDGTWDFMNPTGLGKYLSERQKLVVRYGQNTNTGIEWIQGGVFYLSEWRSPANGIEATFVARDAVEFMLNAHYERSGTKGVVNEEVITYTTKDGVITPSGEAGTGTKVYRLYVGLEVNIVEQSIQCSEKYDDDPDSAGWMMYRLEEYGWVHADKISVTEEHTLLQDFRTAFFSCMPKGSTFTRSVGFDTQTSPISIERTTVAEFAQKSVASCGYTMWQPSDGIIRVMTPAKTLSDYVISSDVSYGHPEVELTKPLKQVEVVHHYKFHPDTKSTIFPVNDEGETVVVDCPYLWKVTSRIEGLANQHIDWWKHRQNVSGEFRADPRLELFDVVGVETKYGTLSPVMIDYLKYTYNGSFRGVYEGKVLGDTATTASELEEELVTWQSL